jgi:HD superfamily phosphohydrolase YqeK
VVSYVKVMKVVEDFKVPNSRVSEAEAAYVMAIYHDYCRVLNLKSYQSGRLQLQLERLL